MTDITEFRTVREFRHAAVSNLRDARESLKRAEGETVEAVRGGLNGAISAVLAGRVGLSQDQQVAYLTEALERTQAGVEQARAAAANPEVAQALQDANARHAERRRQRAAILQAEVDRLTAEAEALEADPAQGVQDALTVLVERADEAQAVLESAKAFAAERDFEAHQAEKQRQRWAGSDEFDVENEDTF